MERLQAAVAAADKAVEADDAAAVAKALPGVVDAQFKVDCLVCLLAARARFSFSSAARVLALCLRPARGADMRHHGRRYAASRIHFEPTVAGRARAGAADGWLGALV